MSEDEIRTEKQQYLYTAIIQAGYEGQEFVDYLESIRGIIIINIREWF